MMSVQTPFRPLCNLSVTTSEPDLTRAQYNSSAINIISHDISSDISISGPLALPRFVFPAKASHDASSPLSSSAAGTGQSTKPSFNFRSDESLCTQDIFHRESSQQSPPISPRTPFPRSGLHKREASEFIGSEKSTSIASLPMRKLPTVDIMRGSHPGGSIIQRRGHAHRRSAAISSGDLSIILRPQMLPKSTGSLPNSPNFDHHNSSFSQGLSSGTLNVGTDQLTQLKEISPPVKSPKNTRVGFSDDVQIIPRPLSMASSDSTSTIRYNHSLSNSISSMVSASASNSLNVEERSTDFTELSRPRTAEPTLENSQTKSGRHCPKRSGSLPSLTGPMTGSLSDISTPRSLKRWTFFGNELSNGALTTKLRPSSMASSWYDQNGVEKIIHCTEKNNNANNDKFQETFICRRNSISKNSVKKQKRVKSWAGSILSNKTKQRSHKQKLRLSSPSLPKLITSSLIVEAEEVSDMTLTSTKPRSDTNYANWKPRECELKDEAISPVIDLDAALGPFNTPISSSGDLGDYSQRNGTRKRAMHSAIGLSRFSGPGMHYHRRTESAPEFENTRFGLHRLGSSSKMTMEDVFEEDEDGEWEDTKPTHTDFHNEPSSMEDESDLESKAGLRIDNSTNQSNISSPEQGVIITDQQISSGNNDQCGENSHVTLPKESISLENTSISEKSILINEIYDISAPKKLLAAQKSALSVSDKPEGGEISSTNLPSTSLQLLSPTGDNCYSVSHTPLPSPVSPFSYEASLISTTQSAILNEREFESLLLGGPGPEMRISVDDVPSLMSSDSISGDSTTTGENLFQTHTTEERIRDGQRSASFSATTANRKRSSMISLSRLINSSHGERSKLAIDTHVSSYSEEDAQQKLGNIGKRIGRIIKFWRKTDSP